MAQGNDEAKDARKQAELNLAFTQSQWPLVRSLTDSLRKMRIENHFAERISLLFEGQK